MKIRERMRRSSNSQSNFKKVDMHHSIVTNILAIISAMGAIASAIFAFFALQASWDAVDQTRRQADIAQETMRSQLRSYVGPVTNSFRHLCDGCDKLNENGRATIKDGSPITYDLRNFGTTPARSLYVCADYIYSERSDYFDEKLLSKISQSISKCDQRPEKMRNVTPAIWPGDARSQLIPPVDTKLLIERESYLFIILSVEYTDIFDAKHQSFICRKYGLSGITDKTLLFTGCDISRYHRDY